MRNFELKKKRWEKSLTNSTCVKETLDCSNALLFNRLSPVAARGIQ